MKAQIIYPFRNGNTTVVEKDGKVYIIEKEIKTKKRNYFADKIVYNRYRENPLWK